MKNMFHIIENSCADLETMFDREVKINNVIDVRYVILKYAMDTVGSCVFGVHPGLMKKNDANNIFEIVGNLIFEPSRIRGLKTMARTIWPGIFYALRMRLFPLEVDVVFHDLLTNIFKERNYKPSSRNDFVDSVLHFKEHKYITGNSVNVKGDEVKQVRIEVDDDVLTGMCVAFFGAGFETSSITMTVTLYELAKNQDAQKKAFEEVTAIMKKYDSKLTYDSVQEMPYVEACTYEATRLYPALSVLTRETIENYVLPTGLKLEKGLRIHIPVYYIHRNSDYYPDPNKFDPERFLPEARQNRDPYTYLGFGEGPRLCIGKRFAKMVMLAGLATILNKYKVEVADNTPSELEMEPKNIVMVNKNDIYLKFVPRDD